MECIAKVRPKQLKPGMLLHIESFKMGCDRPVVYLYFLRKRVEPPGSSRFFMPGWQFIGLVDGQWRLIAHPIRSGLPKLMKHCHIPDG